MRLLLAFRQRRMRRHLPIDIFRSGMSQHLLRDIGVENDYLGQPTYHPDFQE